ncbi:DUF29 domain-containing protein [Crocosphaera sp. UHCC 0190]|uniref:DUF29 domain-containing protein n=1 Tax=Crocosphaera sp. UHCC 0190 TaxID=3110246 RepID=UPI002B20408F|nr:DUF29 domain-containing protein [Crocosphaera sp. UHCC 0190]MEA5510923.1 DUF29 domain-containing protein [Crocosphaera sp. UHCC 0190]
MIRKTKLSTEKLYDQDYQLWLEITLEQLRNSEYSQVDWENLLEEIEGMTRNDKRALKSLLTRLFEHFLKLAYWKSEREYNQAGWEGEIQNFRVQIKELLEDSPSLKPYLRQIIEKSYKDAVKITCKKTRLPSNTFPVDSIANAEQILDDNWLPITCNN